MSSSALKKLTLFLFGVSFYMLYTILLVMLDAGFWIKLLLMIVFAVIAHGLELFFTIGSVNREAPFNEGDFDAFGMVMPAFIYFGFGAFNFLELRSSLLITGAAALFSVFLAPIIDGITGRKPADSKKDDKDDKGE